MWEERYGERYIKRYRNPKKAYVYNLPMGDLKQLIYLSPFRREIIKSMYHDFPEYVTDIESVLLLYDNVCKDGRLNELRDNIVKYL